MAVASDEPRVRHCAELAYARYVPLIGRKPAPMVADFIAQIAAGEVFVATDGQDALEGFIVFRVEGDHILLENVAVLPSAAGRGVGKDLIDFCEAAARERGLPRSTSIPTRRWSRISRSIQGSAMSRWRAAGKTGSIASISKNPCRDFNHTRIGTPRFPAQKLRVRRRFAPSTAISAPPC